jgi:LysR family transcriptional regulator, hydrogen peroxide-inducible genes activator
MSTDPIFDPKATTVPVLRYVVALAEYLHFGRAAAAAHVSQPTLSSLIKQWEKRMGCQVFERDAAGVRTTPVGERVIVAARAALLALEEVELAASRGKPPFYGPVRLGLIPTVAPFALPWMMAACEKQFPEVTFPIREDMTGILLKELESGRIDIAVLALLDHMESRHHCELLYDEPFIVVMPKGHPLAKQKQIEPDALMSERLLLLDEGHCLRDQALAVCDRRADQRLGADYRATSLGTLQQMVGAGVGITIVPQLAVNEDDARVVYRPLAGERSFRTIAMLWRTKDPRATAYQQLASVWRKCLPKSLIKPR